MGDEIFEEIMDDDIFLVKFNFKNRFKIKDCNDCMANKIRIRKRYSIIL